MGFQAGNARAKLTVKAAAPDILALCVGWVGLLRVVAARLCWRCASAACFPPPPLGVGRGSPTAVCLHGGLCLLALVGLQFPLVLSSLACGAVLCSAPLLSFSAAVCRLRFGPPSCGSPPRALSPTASGRAPGLLLVVAPCEFFAFAPHRLRSGSMGAMPPMSPLLVLIDRARTRWVGSLRRRRKRLSRIESRGCSISPGPQFGVESPVGRLAMASKPLLRFV